MAREGKNFPVRVMQKLITKLKLFAFSLLGLLFVFSFGIGSIQAAPGPSWVKNICK